MKIPKSRTTGELIPAVIIEFHDKPLFICHADYWKSIGSWRGYLKEYGLSIRDIKKKHSRLLNPTDFPTETWEG